jgi:RNA polymerase sigma factor (sigma-70 family)
MSGLTTVLAGAGPSRTDRDLVAACTRGDENAWIELIERYKRLIYSVPMRYGLPPEDAADLFQAVCLDLVKELPRLRDPQALPKWLIQTTVHKVIKWRHKHQRYVAGDGTALADTPDAGPLPDALVREFEEEQTLRDAIDVLPDRCRQMVDMLFFETPPRPYAEVAASLGLATGSIGFMRNRCLTKLRKELERLGL